MEIEKAVAGVKANIAQAARESGRGAEDILLCAATKMNDADRVRRAIAAGVKICGENRVQELLEKKAQGAYDGAQLHFIGHLQKNKVRQIIGEVALIQSVDTLELLSEIDRQSAKRGITQDVLLEVNIGAEESKSGFSPAEIPAALDEAGKMAHIRVRGLMAIPPICASPEENKPYFIRMKQLFIDNERKKYDNIRMDFLSMGMSGDYTSAIACGANMVRVGSAIFGERIYPGK